jgi:hypothetical protein
MNSSVAKQLVPPKDFVTIIARGRLSRLVLQIQIEVLIKPGSDLRLLPFQLARHTGYACFRESCD